MTCRLYLAALHFNENAEREQAATQKGDMCSTVHYPRSKRGDFTARPVKTAAIFEYRPQTPGKSGEQTLKQSRRVARLHRQHERHSICSTHRVHGEQIHTGDSHQPATSTPQVLHYSRGGNLKPVQSVSTSSGNVLLMSFTAHAGRGTLL